MESCSRKGWDAAMCCRPAASLWCLLESGLWEKTKWCRNAVLREGELQDWGMGRSVGDKTGV